MAAARAVSVADASKRSCNSTKMIPIDRLMPSRKKWQIQLPTTTIQPQPPSGAIGQHSTPPCELLVCIVTFRSNTFRTETACTLRNRTHNKSLINKTSHLNEKDFIIRMLYKVTVIIRLLNFLLHNFYFFLLVITSIHVYFACHLLSKLRPPTFLIN